MTARSPSIYLAGGITGLTYEAAVEWREDVCALLRPHNIVGFSPMRYKTYIRPGTVVADSYEDHPLCTSKGIQTRDRFDCMRHDLVLVNLMGAQRVSIGTCIELGWADAQRIPIVIAMEADNIHQHSMVRECAGFVLPSLAEAVDTVIAILGDGTPPRLTGFPL